jgi:hypothetical protein
VQEAVVVVDEVAEEVAVEAVVVALVALDLEDVLDQVVTAVQEHHLAVQDILVVLGMYLIVFTLKIYYTYLMILKRTWTQVAAGLFAYNIMSRMAPRSNYYYGQNSYNSRSSSKFKFLKINFEKIPKLL